MSRDRARICADLRPRIATLSPPEFQVMLLVVEGHLNKQVSAALEIAEDTVKVHRRNGGAFAPAHRVTLGRTAGNRKRVPSKARLRKDGEAPDGAMRDAR